MAYCELADLKTYLNDITDSRDDALLTDMIAAAQKIIDTYTRRTFEASADTTRRFDAVRDVGSMDNGVDRVLWLDHDLCQITSITNGDATTVTTGQYVTEPRNYTPWYAIALRTSANIAWTYDDEPENAIAIVGRWAYSITAPDDIQWACKRLAAYLYRQKDTSSEAERPIMSASGASILPSKLPADVRDVLDRYVRRTV